MSFDHAATSTDEVDRFAAEPFDPRAYEVEVFAPTSQALEIGKSLVDYRHIHERIVALESLGFAALNLLIRSLRHAAPAPYSNFAIVAATSVMRPEKPHSLSYHERMRTRLPSTTLVWSRWKVEERGSWLKSIETFLSSV